MLRAFDMHRAPRDFEVTEDLIEVMSADVIPERLRPLALSLGPGSAMSSPGLLQRDVVDAWHDLDELGNLRGPASSVLLGGSISPAGELGAAGVTFAVNEGIVGFVTFAIPAALLVPGGSFYVAYRLYRLVRDTGALRQYARVSNAAPHVAVAVATSDERLTRDEARLLRDLFRGRVGSAAARRGILAEELLVGDRRETAFEALVDMPLEPDDWGPLLRIAIATAHADHEFSGEERELIERLRRLTDFSEDEFGWLAAQAEQDYLRRSELGEAMVAACAEIAMAGGDRVPEDALLLLNVVLVAAVPSDEVRLQLATLLDAGKLRAPTLQELLRGTSRQRPNMFQRMLGVGSEAEERERDFGETMALFLAALEQWRGWVERDCRNVLFEIGRRYELRQAWLEKKLREAHANIEDQRRGWIAPRPWEGVSEPQVELRSAQPAVPKAYAVTGVAGGLFWFHREELRWEWRSASVPFDEFCRDVLLIEVDIVIVHVDDATFELLEVMVDAYQSTIEIRRAEPPA